MTDQRFFRWSLLFNAAPTPVCPTEKRALVFLALPVSRIFNHVAGCNFPPSSLYHDRSPLFFLDELNIQSFDFKGHAGVLQAFDIGEAQGAAGSEDAAGELVGGSGQMNGGLGDHLGGL